MKEPPRLLIIDDDLVMRILISKIGEQLGFEVETACTFADANRMLQDRTYDYITLDLSLGEHSGTQLLRSMADAVMKPNVIVISGCDERILSSAVRYASMLGITCVHVPKPMDLARLRASLLTKSVGPGNSNLMQSSSMVIEAFEVAAALNAGEIAPRFQPKVELATGKITGCEALARWRHPVHGMVPPDVFIPLAEKAGLMPQLTNYVLRRALCSLTDIVTRNPGFSIAVNVSASLLSDISLAEQVDSALIESALPASALTLEITESVVMSDIAKSAEIVLGLRVKGVGVAIDDFGTGHSSLVALARMPFSELKIDKVFVHDSETDRDMERVVRACVRLGHQLDMKVVAEGIETARNCTRLCEIGCDIGQGYFFSPALDAIALASWIEQYRHLDYGRGRFVEFPAAGVRTAISRRD
jgi:EAL domain-containing protein (putative c-di-GMP-specific phosphodiesterase class I)/ActR/RegA family two-component response regulator